MKHLLVTGANGFIGRHLVRRLVAKGYSVACLVRPPGLHPSLAGLPVTAVAWDLLRPESLSALPAGLDAVVHLAGKTKVVRPEEYLAGNHTATVHLVEALLRLPAPPRRMIHVSSQAAAGPAPTREGIDETAPPRPVSRYGESKLAGEQALAPLAAAGCETVILRPPAVYGPEDTDTLEFFKLVRHGFLPLFGREERYYSSIHVADLVRGIQAAIDAPGPFPAPGQNDRNARNGGETPGAIFFLAHPEPATWNGFLTRIAEASGKKLRPLRVPIPLLSALGWGHELVGRLTGRPRPFSRDKVTELLGRNPATGEVRPYWVCRTEKARDRLGFSAAISLSQGIPETYQWYRQVGWLAG